jgi:uncharacterized SAM-binding protein YcdF (DUF218 family)
VTLQDFLFSVGGAATALFACGLVLALRPQARWMRHVVLIASSVYLLGSIRVVPSLLSRPLVAGLAPFQARTDTEIGSRVIVLLAGGVDTVSGLLQDTGVMHIGTAARVLEAARVYKLLAPAWIISSGGGGRTGLVPASLVMRDALVTLGVPPARILLESESRTTRDEAILVAPMLAKLGASEFVLVTSDIHMRRSLATFRGAGLSPIPAIARDPLATQPTWLSLIPTSRGLEFAAGVAHEYVGLAYYAARGWF